MQIPTGQNFMSSLIEIPNYLILKEKMLLITLTFLTGYSLSALKNLLNFGLKKVLVQHGIGLDMSMLFSGVQFTVKDQNLCELSQQAVRGYLAAKSMTETNLGKFAKADLLENQQFISKGLEAEKIICTMLIS